MNLYTQATDRLQDLYLTGVKPNGRDIGVGAYGKVFEVEYCGTICAAKEVHSILVGVGEEFNAIKIAFLTECVRSGSLSHPNIVHFLGVCNLDDQSLLPVLVMEKMQESLTSVVEKYPNIPTYIKLSMLVDVSQGLWYLHTHHPPIVHRDLSPNNVLLTNQFVAKISDLGVAKVIQPDSKKTKTRTPGTVDFMPPEALLETPEYGPPLDVFSYGGVILHVVNQEWPTPIHYVMTDPKTGKILGLSEVERRQQHMEKMTGTPVDLQYLVEQCLDNQPNRRPLISDVSERMKRMKEVESVMKCPNININPITWKEIEQTSKMLREAMITAPTAKLQQQHTDSQVDIFRQVVKWKELAPLPVYRLACYAVLLGGSVYVGGGYERTSTVCKRCYRLDVYNLATNQWSPSPITTPYSRFAMTVLDDKVITVGGETKDHQEVKKVLVLCSGHWKDYSEMPTARCNATAVVYHSMLIVVGGTLITEDKVTVLSTTELLDTTNGCWYTCNNLPSPHYQLKAAIMNDVLYLLGGFVQGSKQSTKVYTASLDTLSTHQLNWQSASCTPYCLSAPVVLHSSFLLTIGGVQESDINKVSSEVCTFNTSTSQWKPLTTIPTTRTGPAVVAVDDKILVIGGLVSRNIFSKVVWIGMFE